MAYYGADGLYFAIDDTAGTLRQISGLTSIDGLPGEIEAADSTAIGDTVRKSHPTLYNVEFNIEGWYDDSASVGSQTVLQAIWAEQQGSPTTDYTFEFGPEGSTTGMPKRTGQAKVMSYTEGGRVGELVNFRASFKAQTITITGTFST